MNRILTSGILFFVLSILILSGQDLRYSFGHLDYTDGLSHNRVICVVQDQQGFMWFGTMSGLNRYDGYQFKVFKRDPFDSTSLPDNMVEALTLDQLGRIWIRTPQGLCLFNSETENFDRELSFISQYYNNSVPHLNNIIPCGNSLIYLIYEGTGLIKYNIFNQDNTILYPSPNNPHSISSENISSATEADNDHIWVIYEDGILELINTNTDKVVKHIKTIRSEFDSESNQYDLFLDRDNDLWIFPRDVDNGLIWYRPDTDSYMRIQEGNSPFGLNSNIITRVVQDIDGMIWIGTDHGGVNIFNKNDNTIRYLLHDPEIEQSLAQNVVTNLYKDNSGIIWVLSFKKGISFYHPNLFKFYHYMNHPADPNSLTYNDVNCFAEDQQENIWIGTNGYGIIYFDRKKQIFKNYRNDPANPNSLSNDVIVNLHVDEQDNLWIGTYFGGLCKFDGINFKTYRHDANNYQSLSDDRVWQIFVDSKDNFWVGTLGGGLDLFDKKTETFRHYSGEDHTSVRSQFVMDLAEDKHGNLWIGTENGIFVLNWKTGRIIHYEHLQNNHKSLSSNFVYSVFKDSRGLIWAGTRDGLNLFDETEQSFTNFSIEDGLADNNILSILESDLGNLWIGTSNGLSKFVVISEDQRSLSDYYIVNYNESDGLQGREFNEGSAFKTSKGELIFGGVNGFNLFDPSQINGKPQDLSTYIIGLEIFSEPVKVNENIKGRQIINSSILNNQTVKLRYHENILTLEFAAINYLRSKKIRYRYKLEGFNDHWMNADWTSRKVTYTNLSPGKYIFKVQASESNDNWEDAEASMSLVIKPPIYRTFVAYLIYLIIALLILMIFRRFLIIQERMKYEKEQVLQESKRQHELNVLKTRFFTNVSHEFRTPLTLIITPLEKLIKQEQNSEMKSHLSIIYQNARRLLTLVNQLLDFRKMEEKRLSFNPDYGNIVSFTERTVKSFSDLAETKNINLSFKSIAPEIFMQFDRDKMEKVFYNLLSNAFKFTPEGGKIMVHIELHESKQLKEKVYIKFIDTGIGISKQKHKKIFERFFQEDAPTNLLSQGSGIGLSLAKEFIKLHHGKIKLESEPEKGSTFIVVLPVIKKNESLDSGKQKPELTLTENISKADGALVSEKHDATILLVEDNDDFRFYLRDNLKVHSNILEASNGTEALNVVEKNIPDLIVSDIMMPEMDGLELCKRIKGNPTTSHIPIILLTARITEKDKMEGYNLGADEYIIKPFSFEILESRIDYLLSQRKRFVEAYQKTFKIEPNAKGITSLDEKLMKKALQYVEDNLTDPNLSVESLSSHLGFSRVHLYKKMIALTGKSPIEFIRLVRLKKAAVLLAKSQLSVSEIAYQVGFSDPRYFSKQFKSEFKVLPSKFKADNESL